MDQFRRGSRPSSGARRVGRFPVRGAADRWPGKILGATLTRSPCVGVAKIIKEAITSLHEERFCPCLCSSPPHGRASPRSIGSRAPPALPRQKLARQAGCGLDVVYTWIYTATSIAHHTTTTKGQAGDYLPRQVAVTLQRVLHGPAFGALQPADQRALASKFRNPLWAPRLAAK